VPSSSLPPSTRRLHRLAEVTSELLAAESREAVAKVVTERLTDAAEADIGSLSLMLDDETLELIGIRGVRDGVAAEWATYAVSGTNPAAEACRTRETVLAVGLEEVSRRYPGLEMAVEGERTLLSLPLLMGDGRCVGVLSLSFAGIREIDDAEMVFLRLLADTCATSIDRIDAQAAAKDREAKLAFLAEATAELIGDLDYESTLVAVAEAAVPWFADWCAIALEDDGYLRHIAVAHNQPELEGTVRELLERYPASPDDHGGSYEVLRTGESNLVPDVTDEMLVLSAKDDEHLRLIRKLELRSGMSCPLKVRDHVFGVITWVTGEGGRRFGPDDLEFGEEIARRAAVAIDNAQLHSQVRDVALELQQAVLPAALPEVDGWRAAVRYLPAGRTDAGGDFYDLVPLDGGRLAMFVGDVMGRGVQATSVMAQMRSAMRTLIAIDPRPEAVMAGLDRVFETLHVDQLVTTVYALAESAGNRLEVVSAGHPEPLVVRADGTIEALSQRSTLLLGAGGGERSVLDVQLCPGDALLLYTDGLVERRGEDSDDGTARLVTALTAYRSDDLEDWLTRVVETTRDPTRDDDVAALLLARER
jgi:serine phosphatase RsbU (regulator of sigma subunit)